jgi:hypothetical protein
MIGEEKAVQNYMGWTNEEKIWLSADFRTELLNRAIEKAGSVNQLGRVLGYRSRVHPGWSVRQLLTGAQPFTLQRLRTLAEFTGCPMDRIMKYQVPKRRALNHQNMMANPEL